MTKVYVSPSSQQANLYASGNTNEEIMMNLVADVLCDELARHGVEYKRNSPSKTFAEHIVESNAYDPDFHVAIHSNAGGTTARGCTIFAYKPSPEKIGTQLANNIYKYIEPLTPTADRGVKDGSTTLSEVAKTSAPAVLIEVDFHDKIDGAKWIIANVRLIAIAILRGILDQANLPYIEEKPTVDPCLEKEAIIEDLNKKLSDEQSKTTELTFKLSNSETELLKAKVDQNNLIAIKLALGIQ